jgi:AcrR family transcriptional regulator
MPRQTPPGRLADVAHAACQVFIDKGYRRALLTDVAAELGLSHALLYRCAQSKEALFELALRHAINPDEVTSVEVPVPTPAPGRFLQLVREWAADQARFPVLDAAVEDHGDSSTSENVAGEVAGIVGECYAFIERARPLLALIERSAPDLPELYEFYYTRLRRSYLARLTDYLRARIGAGALRPVPEVGAAARFVVESVAWFAWHRVGDPDSAEITDELARQTVSDLLVAALLPPGGNGA